MPDSGWEEKVYETPGAVFAVIDRWDVWINTKDENDIEFFENLAESFGKVQLLRNPD